MRQLLLGVLALSLLACDAVPMLVFDGSTSDATVDGTASDAADGGPADTGEPPEGGCPNELPDGATLCCGRIACFGLGCPVACPGCVQLCVPTEVCCPNPQGKAFCKLGTGC
jgi:hypothetical protein